MYIYINLFLNEKYGLKTIENNHYNKNKRYEKI